MSESASGGRDFQETVSISAFTSVPMNAGGQLKRARYVQVELVFHNVPYYVSVSTIDGETLCVEVEQQSDCSRWRGDFTSRCESGAVAPKRSKSNALPAGQPIRSRRIRHAAVRCMAGSPSVRTCKGASAHASRVDAKRASVLQATTLLAERNSGSVATQSRPLPNTYNIFALLI